MSYFAFFGGLIISGAELAVSCVFSGAKCGQEALFIILLKFFIELVIDFRNDDVPIDALIIGPGKVASDFCISDVVVGYLFS